MTVRQVALDLAWQVFILWVWTYVQTAVHEIAHFAVAYRLRLALISVNIGVGPLLKTIIWRGIVFTFRCQAIWSPSRVLGRVSYFTNIGGLTPKKDAMVGAAGVIVDLVAFTLALLAGAPLLVLATTLFRVYSQIVVRTSDLSGLIAYWRHGDTEIGRRSI
jgi:hypothetical protein